MCKEYVIDYIYKLNDIIDCKLIRKKIQVNTHDDTIIKLLTNL